MKKRWLGILLALCLLVCLAPAALAAEVPAPASNAVYVSSANSEDLPEDVVAGNDETGEGTQAAPYASLAKAVDALKGKTGEIYLLSDITASRLALVDGENGTPANITIDGQGNTVTRSDNFAQAEDQGRGGYNPAMIEVANGSTLTLEDITLDDNFERNPDTVFEEQKTAEGEKGNESRAHDSIIAAYGDGKGTIILGEGTTLKNFGGMSAVRIGGNTDGNGEWYGSTLIMEAGSKIVDGEGTREGTREGGYAAVWSQGGQIRIDSGASIHDIDGRAIYLEDGGSALVNGEIHSIVPNNKMQYYNHASNGGFGGMVCYAEANSSFTLGKSGVIRDLGTNSKSIDVAIMLVSSTMNTLNGSSIKDIETIGIVDNNGGTIELAGTVTNCDTGKVFFRLRGTQNTFKLQESGIIKNCSTTDAGIVYLNGGKPTIQIDGEISDIEAGEIIFISGNGLRPDGTCTLSATGKITRVSGDAILAGDPSKVTILGEISHCGGYAIRYTPIKATVDKSTGSSLLKIESGARITDNHNGGPQILVTSKIDKNEKPYSADTKTKHVFISNDNVLLSNRGIQLDKNTITLAENYDDVKLGNLSTDNDTTLNTESNDRGWNKALATFWMKSETAQELTLSGLSSVEEKLPIYALVMPTGKDGDIDDESSAAVYAVTGNGDDTYTLNLPATYETGWAVALVQPTKDYGTLTLVADPATLTEDVGGTVNYTATYAPAGNLISQLADGDTFTLTITLAPGMTYVANSFTGLTDATVNENTITVTGISKQQLVGGLTAKFSATAPNKIEAGDTFVTNAVLEGNITVQDSKTTVTLVDTATVTVTAKPEDPIEPTDPPYIPPVDPDEPADPDDTGVSDLLNTEDHIQYLFGYPDGTFGPENNMTRAEVAQMFYNLLLDQDVEITKTFDDVPANAWYAKAVNTLASLDIISGVGDNKFEPERSITRAEFTAMAMKFAVGGEEGENIFSDVDENDWFYDAVVNSIQYGWIHGYGDGTFRPNNPITRAEVTAIVNNMLGRAADEDFVDEHAEELTPFSDIEKHWAYYHIVEATNDHDYTKPSSGENWTKLN